MLKIKKATCSKTLPADLEYLDKCLFKPGKLILANVEKKVESKEYAAHTFTLGNKIALFRRAKITPTKTGQFVTIWKRNQNGITTPFDISDAYDVYLVAVRKGPLFGLFIFPKTILYRHGALAGEKKTGKRGMRVYASWDRPVNAQAQRSQTWQAEYFLEITPKTDPGKAKELLNG